MSNIETQYLNLVRKVLDEGVESKDRTGVGTKSIFGPQLRCDLSEGFPLLTTKKVFFKGVKAELLWFLAGDTNIKWLNEQGVHIWDEWSDENGDLGPVYGRMWRQWPTDAWWVDQIAKVIDQIETNPYSRRHLVSAWNVGELERMALVPCHYSFQFYVRNSKISLLWNQRSVDCGLGLPFNIASYALLCHMVAQVTGLEPGELIFNGGDTHVYRNHEEALKEQLSREPYDLPQLWLNPEITDIDDFTLSDIKVKGYKSHGKLPMPIAV